MAATPATEPAKKSGCGIGGLVVGTVLLTGAVLILVWLVFGLQAFRGSDEPWSGTPFWIPEPLFEGFVPAETVHVDFSDECPACGANFTVDEFQLGLDGTFRLHMTITNTGGHGALRYAGANVYAMTAEQAERYALGLEDALATGQLGPLLNNVTGYRYVSTTVPDEDSLPSVIWPGAHWTGWVHFTTPRGSPAESSVRLPRDVVALVLVLSPESAGAQPAWISSATARPYISIR